jgi:c-di-GMP-binding flagellar brake protein YcgR
MSSEKNRRRFARVAEFEEISYSIIPHSKIRKKLTLDLSVGGSRFISDDFIPVGSLLKIEIKLKSSQRVINAIAKIMWVKSLFGDERYEIGVEFTHIKKEDAQFFQAP